MALEGWRLIAISLDYAHHAGGSGYGQLTRHIEFDAVVVPPKGALAKGYDRFVSKARKVKIIDRLTRRRTSTEVRYLIAHGARMRKLVHVLYGEHHSWLLRLLPNSRRSRKVATIHLPPALWHVAFRSGQLSNFDAVILMSESQVVPLREGLGFRGLVKVVPHGVDIERFAFVERKITKQVHAIMVGNFLRDYAALARIAQESVKAGEDIVFHVVASVAAAGSIADHPNVRHYVGIRDEELIELYHQAHVAVFTMQDCTANNALLEAISTGLPVVANDIGGIRTYVDDSFASLIDAEDPARYVATIREMTADPGAYGEMSRNARLRAESMSWERTAEATMKVYREVIGS